MENSSEKAPKHKQRLNLVETNLSGNKQGLTTLILPLVLSCVWILMVFLVNPIGEFPLNDAWSYSKSVSLLVNKSRLHFTGWVSVPLIAQVFWGALFCLPFGFSFTALRLSTLVLGLIGILATYSLLKEAGANQAIAFLGALTVATNPLYFELSNTFMTDVPFLGLTLLSFLLLIRGIRRERNIDLLLGTLVSCAAVLIRQSGIVIPLAFGVGYLAKNGVNRKTLGVALFTIALVVGTLIGYQLWLQTTLGLPASYHAPYKQLLTSLKRPMLLVILSFVKNGTITLIYLGLFLLPFLIILALYKREPFSNKVGFVSLLILSCFLLTAIRVSVWKNRLMPLLTQEGNILIDFGLGPLTLRDVFLLRLPHFPTAPKALWLVITIGGIIGAMMLLWHLSPAVTHLSIRRKKAHSKNDKWFIRLVVSACVFYFIPLGIAGFFDRYLILLLPLLMSAIVAARGSVSLHRSCPSNLTAVALLTVYAGFSMGATHDYLSWNRARWKALSYLTEEAHVPYKNIDGGFEFNGWYGYDSEYQRSYDKSWWWVVNDDYVISFGPITSYEVKKSYPYQRWIPPGQGKISILQKLASSKRTTQP